MIVDRCICCDKTFKHLLELGEKNSASVNEVCKSTGCGGRCGMCLPYIYKVFMTKNPRVPLMSELEAQKILAEANMVHGVATSK